MSHSGPHPADCGCPLCSLETRIRADEAQAQTLILLTLLDSVRQRLRLLNQAVTKQIPALSNRRTRRRLAAITSLVNKRCSAICDEISFHIGPAS